MKTVKYLVFSIFLAACAPAVVETKTTFNPSEVEWIHQTGSNTLKGSALVRQRGGGVVTCAGLGISAVPYSSYAEERISYIYGSITSGYNRLGETKLPVGEADSRYVGMVKNTICNAQGFFEFKNLPDGDYFIVSLITWQAGRTTFGGTLMRKISLRSGEEKEIVLVP